MPTTVPATSWYRPSTATGPRSATPHRPSGHLGELAVAETGTGTVVESEGNGGMCPTLPKTLITVIGIEKMVPTWRDLEVFLQLLPRSSTGEPMLRCIRCSACLNVCPVYERTGGHAYGSVYPGPIGAVLSPQLIGVKDNPSLPFASG